jgi:putative transposase
MKIAIKVRIKPTEEQESLLWQSAGTARWAYNWCLNKQIENHVSGEKFIQDGILRKELTQLKKTEQYKWLNNVSAQIPKQAIKDCCKAYISFFNKKTKFPNFKSRKKSKPSFFIDSYTVETNSDSILIEKIGWLILAEKDRLLIKSKKIKYYNPRVTYDGKYWYIAVAIDVIANLQKLEKKSLGIDLGLKSFAVCSDGKVFKNINKSKKVKKVEKKLKRLQRKVSRKYNLNKKGETFVKTSNIIKEEKKVRLVYRKLRNIRNNYLHQTSSAIVKTKPSRIVMENLNVRGMMKNKHLSKAISQQNFSKFKGYVKYKSELNSIDFVSADRFFPSSKLCSNCGNIKKDLKLSDRTYVCSICGLVIDRDINASINLSNYETANNIVTIKT